MKDNDFVDLNQERDLNEKIALLAKETTMTTDRWPEIKTVISDSKLKSEAKLYSPKWGSWAIAASLILSLASLTFSWNNLQKAQVLYTQMEKVNNNQQNQYLAYKDSVDYQVSLMEQEFMVAKVGLYSRISMNRAHIDKGLLSQIEKQLTEFKIAGELLKSAIEQQPNNSRLPILLSATYQQELAVLTQLAKLDNTI